MSLSCGIDVGGTKIAGAVVDAKGAILEEARVESPATDREAIEAAIAGLVADLRTRHEVDSVGIGFAGYVDAGRARVLFAPNLAMRDLDLKRELEEQVGLPVVIENDANSAAWGEFAFGAAEDVDDLLMVTVGTGVGGGLVLRGELYRGAYGVAAEIGHLRVVPDGHLCGCGNRGCLEQYGSGTALVREARTAAAGGAEQVESLLARAGGDPSGIHGALITEAARDGDPFAVDLLASLGRWLGHGIASLTTVLDPAAVVIGGGVSEAGDLLLDPLRAAFESQLIAPTHRPVAEIRLATLGNKAGVIGAADLARR
ncbi:ROK family glucokinase [Nocardioides sp. cx-169]|uniref:ROK family glucokinase n=1 Tax=Nocardioides sp. cx-169 TaxID=2899080 RepID=UPI001E49BF31|nr:ROK family glucokinase [Nocardioides sp. cx-169]MCD4534690.1 ROK family glucokinase [Nocardioides sp. cx-169]